MTLDDMPDCPDRCFECPTLLSVDSDSGASAVAERELHFVHGGLAGERVEIQIGGCAGSVRVVSLIPAEQPLTVQPPEAVSGDRTGLRWSPSGAAEVQVSLTNGSTGTTCRVADTGSYDAEFDSANVSSVTVESRFLLERVNQGNALLDVFRTRSGEWESAPQ
jgi:hypothetical protein